MVRQKIIRYDGATGQESWRYTSPGELDHNTWAVRSDGMIFVVETTQDFSGYSALVGIDGTTGSEKLRVPIPPSTGIYYYDNCAGQTTELTWDWAGPPMVGPDGSVSMVTHVTHIDGGCGSVSAGSYDESVRLLQVAPDGTPIWTDLHDNTNLGESDAAGEVIPDGQGGLLASWEAETSCANYNCVLVPHVTHMTATGNTDYTLPLNGWGSGRFDAMVLGENGTAFANDGAKFVSFNIASGAVNWTWTASSGSGEMIAASAGNGLVVKQYDNDGSGNYSHQVVVRLDPTGQATYDAWTGNSVDYAFGDMWLGLGSAESPTAPEISLADSSYPFNGGNVQKQGAPSLPTLAYFIPIDPGPDWSAEQEKASMQKTVPRQIANNDIRILQDATIDSFLSVVKNKVGAVAFIGHSFDIQLEENGPIYSIGICFYSASGDQLENCIVRTPDPSVPALNYGSDLEPTDRKVDKIQTGATVVFIGACNVGTAFLDLWDINDSTIGRAMVVIQDPSQGVHLATAGRAWESIALNLVKNRTTIQAAVDQANILMGQDNVAERWKVIGDPNAKVPRNTQ